MPAPMSLDLRLRIVRAVEQGSSIRGAARRFAVSPSAAIKLMQRVRATGSVAPGRAGGHRRPRLEPHEADLRDHTEEAVAELLHLDAPVHVDPRHVARVDREQHDLRMQHLVVLEVVHQHVRDAARR